MLDLQFLGTSAGIPTKTRNVTSLAVGQTDLKPWLMVDCGEGTQQQVLHTDWSASNLSAVCITHVHGDHCYGLPGMIASAGLNKRTKPLTIIGPAPIWQWLQHTIALTDLYLSFELQFIDVETLLESEHELDGFSIRAYPLSHRVPSYAYQIRHQQSHRRLKREQLLQDGLNSGPEWGLLHKGMDVAAFGKTYYAKDYVHTETKRVCVVVGGDNDSPALLQDACADAQLLVHEATYTQAIADKVGSFPMHSSAKQVAEFAQKMAIPHLLLTHFSARYATFAALQALLTEAQQHYQGQVYLAEDFARYRLLDNGELHFLEPSSS